MGFIGKFCRSGLPTWQQLVWGWVVTKPTPHLGGTPIILLAPVHITSRLAPWALEVDTPILNTASSWALVDFSTQHHKRPFRNVVVIRENDLDRYFLKMLGGKEISSHIRGGQVIESVPRMREREEK